jgi:hypothetical protein
MSKKCFIDGAFLGVFAVVTFFAIILVSFLYGTIKDGLNSFEVIGNDTNVQTIFSHVDIVNTNWDWVFMLMFFGLVGGAVIGLYFLRSSPVLFMLGLIGLFTVIIMSIILVDVFGQVINESPEFSAEVSDFPVSGFIFNFLPVILLVVLGGFLIFTYMNKGGYV